MKFAKHHLLNLNKTTTCFKKPSKNDEKCFLFRLKNSFRSQDISVFVLNFSSDHSHKKQIVWKHYSLNGNFYVMLKFTERPKTPGMTSKKH